MKEHSPTCDRRHPRGPMLAAGWIDGYAHDVHVTGGRRGFEIYICACGADYIQAHWDWAPAEAKMVAERFGVPFFCTITELREWAGGQILNWRRSPST